MSQDFVSISVEELHGGKPITKIVVSPNDQYLITYSDADNSFVGWDVKDKDEGQLKPDGTHFKVIDKITIKQICVSDEKKLAYIYSFQGRNCLSKYFSCSNLLRYCGIN